jgi:hypothetical protein
LMNGSFSESQRLLSIHLRQSIATSASAVAHDAH